VENRIFFFAAVDTPDTSCYNEEKRIP